MAFGRARPRTNKIYDESALYDYAVWSLSRRMRTVAEIKRLMRNKVLKQPDGAELIERVVERLKDHGYLNDTSFAATYSSFRKENEKFGRRRVEQDLKIKGVHGDVIEKTLTATYADVDEVELARKFIARKRLKKPIDQKQTARIFRMLVRAGFSTRAIITILKTWEIEEETLSALEQETTEASPEEDSTEED